MFKDEFKYYKSRKPPPNLKDVLDFNGKDASKLKVRSIKAVPATGENEKFCYMKPVDEWDIYELLENPGLIFIKNPFTPKGQRYWISRCLRDYPRPPNKSNLDPHNILTAEENWWDVCQKDNDVKLLNKLRWITFGYHHNWDTKIYSEDSKSEFPQDLNLLCKYIAKAINFPNFEAEAAIVNYYHMDSTLSGHTDHSEQNLDAPLFSFSFGQSAIFLLGGKTNDIKPTAMFLHSGDIAVMSKESRLSYHGVPKICPAPEEVWNLLPGGGERNGEFQARVEKQVKSNGIENDEESKRSKNCSSEKGDSSEMERCELPKCFQRDIAINCDKKEFWLPFDKYLGTSRVNINVRQVLNRGQKRLLED